MPTESAPLEMPPEVVAEAMSERTLDDFEDIEALAGISSFVKANMDNVEKSYDGARPRTPTSRLDIKTIIRTEANKIKEAAGGLLPNRVHRPPPPQQQSIQALHPPQQPTPQMEFQFAAPKTDVNSQKVVSPVDNNAIARFEVRLKGIEKSLDRIGDLLVQLVENSI